jgi:hypothetical protein
MAADRAEVAASRDRDIKTKAPDQTSGAHWCTVQVRHQNRKLAPPRKMLVVNDTLPVGARAQLSPQLKLPRST